MHYTQASQVRLRMMKGYMMKSKKCTAVELHAGHICELESEQDWDTLAKVTSKPTVRCENCGTAANSSANVCMPADL